jgi:integrase
MDINITRRKRRRVQRDGSVKHQVRWIVSSHIEGVRHQRFFEARVQAAEFSNRLLTNEAPARPSNVTVGDAIRAWLETRKSTTRANTHTTYEHRAKLLEPLTSVRIDRLATRSIREWHDGIDTVYSANKALSVLKSAPALHAEDTGTRSIPMPTNLQKRLRPTRKHLSIDQVRAVIASGSIYVTFPFLAGTRISEQLGLCWDCVDFDAGLVHIKRSGQANWQVDRDDEDGVGSENHTDERDAAPNARRVEASLSLGGASIPRAARRRVALFQFPASNLATRAPTHGAAASKHSFGEGELHINAPSKRRRCSDSGEAGWSHDAECHPPILHSFATRWARGLERA